MDLFKAHCLSFGLLVIFTMILLVSLMKECENGVQVENDGIRVAIIFRYFFSISIALQVPYQCIAHWDLRIK